MKKPVKKLSLDKFTVSNLNAVVGGLGTPVIGNDKPNNPGVLSNNPPFTTYIWTASFSN